MTLPLVDTSQSLQLWKGADEQKEQVFQAMQRYEQYVNHKHKTCKSVDEIRDTNHTWGDVMKEVEVAGDARENRYKFMRKLAKNADGFEVWLSLLPNNMYTSIICGAFKIGLLVPLNAEDSRCVILTDRS